jgi:flavin reductase
MIATHEFRDGMSLLTGAVNVITTDGPAGRAGFTASAVCSVSDDPPTLLVCVNRSAQTHRVLVGNGVLCVNVLAAAQEPLSVLFSSRQASMEDRFEAAPWSTLETGAPVLDGALVSFDGRIAQTHDVGTHTIFYVWLSAIRRADTPEPVALAYFGRRYHHLGTRETSVEESAP